jgi:hypothetical protein
MALAGVVIVEVSNDILADKEPEVDSELNSIPSALIFR